MTYPYDILAQPGPRQCYLDLLDQRPFVTRANKAPHTSAHEREAEHYTPSDGLKSAINTAIALGRPLLLTGAPGSGKTQAAHWIAWKLQIAPVLEFHVKSTSTSRDLIYEFEAVRYMAAAMRTASELPSRQDFLLRRPLWEAFIAPHPRVLLVDEIDKAPRDFPNDLLREFDQWVIEIDEAREGEYAGLRVPAPPKNRPIVIITSNGERPLPDPFLRRCIFHHIELEEKDIKRILINRRDAGELRACQDLIEKAAQVPEKLRSVTARPPGVDELFAWLGILEIKGIPTVDLDKPLPDYNVLLKSKEDLDRVKPKDDPGHEPSRRST